LFEIFTNLGKAGGCPSQSEATARVLSVAVRYLRLDLDGSSDSKQTLKYYRDRGAVLLCDIIVIMEDMSAMIRKQMNKIRMTICRATKV